MIELQEHAHLFDELGYVIDGLEDESYSIARSSGYRLALLCHDSTTEVGLLLRAHDLFDRVFTALSRVPPSASEAALLSAVSTLYFLLRDNTNISHVTTECLSFLAGIVNEQGRLLSATTGTPTPSPSKRKQPLSARRLSDVGSLSPLPQSPHSPRTPLQSRSPARRSKSPLSVSTVDWLFVQAKTPDAPGGRRSRFGTSPATPSSVPEEAQLAKLRELLGDCNLLPEPSALRSSGLALECLQLVTGPLCDACVRDMCRVCGAVTATLTVLRSLGALIAAQLGDPGVFWQAENCLKFLENVTFMNAQNQLLLADVPTDVPCLLHLVASTRDLEKASEACEPLLRGSTARAVLHGALKVLLNFTENHDVACTLVAKHGGLPIICSLLCLKAGDTYDTQVLTMSLLANLCEHNGDNRALLGNTSVDGTRLLIPAVVDIFVKQTGGNCGGEGDGSCCQLTEPSSASEAPKEQKVCASYAALLLGCLVNDNAANGAAALAVLPGHSFAALVDTLEYFISFQMKAGIFVEETRASYHGVLRALGGNTELLER
eukprot:TRINITY_DN2123_c0_g1_i1.p1 TRINITY_DN2123_c0_g1~~TRINITY_DN2123_c0_g1_i1.p1  ORF type:complete len:547 (+),score=146.83 TRINITY_DN2123_c0_g1_i1:1682-3322(+)